MGTPVLTPPPHHHHHRRRSLHKRLLHRLRSRTEPTWRRRLYWIVGIALVLLAVEAAGILRTASH
ncbi:MAG TPA: hypothetical protein VHW65_08475 [Gemmatimonadales bacterium]|nr:hypothetical protein [Gemmatimonadales bacterium]